MLRPPTCARDRPSTVTVRLSSTEPSSSISAPASVIRAATASAERPGQPQPALDHRPARVGAHPAGVGPAAEQQPEAGHHHRLAGAGLTGDDVHARRQRQRRVVDDAQPGDAQLLQHRARQYRWHTDNCPPARPGPRLDQRRFPRQPSTGRANLATSGSVNGRGAQPDQPHRQLAAPHRDLRAGRQVPGAPAVAAEHRERRVRVHGDRERRGRRGHQRPAEQRVRADRHQQQRLHLGPHHRAAGRERVRRRAGRRGAHHTVAAVPRQRPAVHVDQQLEHLRPLRPSRR